MLSDRSYNAIRPPPALGCLSGSCPNFVVLHAKPQRNAKKKHNYENLPYKFGTISLSAKDHLIRVNSASAAMYPKLAHWLPSTIF